MRSIRLRPKARPAGKSMSDRKWQYGWPHRGARQGEWTNTRRARSRAQRFDERRRLPRGCRRSLLDKDAGEYVKVDATSVVHSLEETEIRCRPTGDCKRRVVLRHSLFHPSSGVDAGVSSESVITPGPGPAVKTVMTSTGSLLSITLQHEKTASSKCGETITIFSNALPVTPAGGLVSLRESCLDRSIGNA